MEIHVYVTDQCKADGKKHGFTSELDRLMEKVESDGSLGSWDRFLPSPFIRKKLGSYRLIAEEWHMDGVTVVCFAALMHRGDSRYDAWIANPSIISPSGAKQELREWLDDRRKKTPAIVVRPSNAESEFLYCSASHEDDEVVFETPEWVDKIHDLPREARGWLINLLTEKVLCSRDDVTIVRGNDVGIIFRRFTNSRYTLLIAPLFKPTSEQERAILERHADLLATTEMTEFEIRRRSKRAYPALVAADSGLWFSIQEDQAANLALSPEEVDVLQSVLRDASSTEKYPLFINGRPGSGKSTVLQYIFAEYFAKYVTANDLPSAPLYLTYSEQLLDKAKSAVSQLVNSNAGIQLGVGEVSHDKINAALNGSFKLLHDYLLDLLPEDRKSVLSRNNRITYSKFRSL